MILNASCRSYKAKVVQIFEFAHMNEYFESNEAELVFPVCKEDGGEKQPLPDIKVTSPSLASSSSSSSSGHGVSSPSSDDDSDA